MDANREGKARMTTTIDRDEYMRKFEEWQKAQEPAKPEPLKPITWKGHYECAKCGCREFYRPHISGGEWIGALFFGILLPLLILPLALYLTIPVLLISIPIRSLTTPKHCSDCGSRRIKWVNETI